VSSAAKHCQYTNLTPPEATSLFMSVTDQVTVIAIGLFSYQAG
jgi:hypothetical protein